LLIQLKFIEKLWHSAKKVRTGLSHRAVGIALHSKGHVLINTLLNKPK